MPNDKTKYYEVYRDAEKIDLEEIVWQEEETGIPNLKVKISIDDRIIENVTFRRDILSRAYAMPPDTIAGRDTAITILFGGEVQEILDRFADHIVPPMKPLGINHLSGEKVLNFRDRIDTSEIENVKRKISENQFCWLKYIS